ncbi:cation:proton antiporter [Candidatus Omnitrophota bacterium]
MHYLSEHNIFLFLIQVSLLLGLARGAGVLLRKIRQPAITGEILVGVILGPSIVGRYFPSFFNALFPQDQIQQNMLETVAWFGVLFFLLNTGLEIDFKTTWKQRGDALKISVSDIIIPMVIAFIPCLFLPGEYMGQAGNKLFFSLFIATVMTISALPVTARILNDLAIYKTDVGYLIMSALSINDIIGWIVFTLILGFFTDQNIDIISVVSVIGFTFIFTSFCLTKGIRIVNALITKIKEKNLPEPGSSLTLISVIAMVCGAITLKIGIHALFGFFIAGIMAGESKSLPEKTRHTISDMVQAIFIPLFFTNIGLKIDFFSNFDSFLVMFILVIGVTGRYVGAYTGMLFTKQPKANRNIISIAHTPGGEMQIVVGILALEYHLISVEVFVAIIFGAVITSIIAGPWMSLSLKRKKAIKITDYFIPPAFVDRLKSKVRDEAIAEIIKGVVDTMPAFHAEELTVNVIDRENITGTAIGNSVAVPHARIKNLYSPVISYGRSIEGIEWNSPDGNKVYHIFLILTPENDDGIQLQILRSIAQFSEKYENIESIENVTSEELISAFKSVV